ncbi:metal ABC transporter substrate-binding protein [Pinisolibacter aquiterrae]|uniref:metal ABC transporter substrate-binding protein n=1 Tax=Pinisolibacter aquiterrae TaxID=2815579 RepID=UPI001C3C969D|nr:metal ABC transporter substrate-binding protein [Pinisolibacter aquiterrae]MBV5263655.1 metal ABC transporter substrate-binding protein [Pinisolibacter aquiterrae]MCC8235147.1 metal ABC transporter substrate-binding protein [Pinisolibacter aquiterrae]
MIVVSRRSLFAATATLALAAATRPLAVAAETRLPVVASFSILADLIARVGGERVTISTLVGPNGDAHVFQPKPSDAKTLAAAKLVFVNGLGFEGWMDRLVAASGTRAAVVVASKGVVPQKAEDEGEAHGAEAKAGHDHDHGAFDPHAWQSIDNVKLYVANIRDALIVADPEGREVYTANAAAFTSELAGLDAEVRAKIAAVPAARRRVITSHDAFGYFATTYGIEFVAPQGLSTDAEPSAKAVAALIRQIRREHITAVFIENMTDGRLVKRIAKETGVVLGGELYSDSLSPKGGPASTYVDMVRNNVKLLTAAMADS